jgi:hypothetical protein
MGRTTLRGILCLCLVMPCAMAARAPAQEFSSSHRDAATAFLADADAEAKRGVYLFYTQSYVDTKKEKVALHGSLYGVLRDVKVTGCDIEGTVQIFDLFSGQVKDRPTGEVQDLTEYSIKFRLTGDIASALTLIQGRPAQLAHKMNTKCEEDASCTFNWLRIRSARRLIHEEVVLNHSITFDDAVEQVLAPISSADAGRQLMRDLQEMAGTQCK